ncbi:hypothetical protein D3C71_1810420 [compost metagenome]
MSLLALVPLVPDIGQRGLGRLHAAIDLDMRARLCQQLRLGLRARDQAQPQQPAHGAGHQRAKQAGAGHAQRAGAADGP